jgi:acyl-CoA synthetase (AMP-forming)/AMP-acid ligase II
LVGSEQSQEIHKALNRPISPSTLESSANIASQLHAMAQEQPHTLAVVVPQGRGGGRRRYSHFTYAQLDRESEHIAAGLLASGISPGTRAAVMVKPGLDFFALTFALFRAGVVPVLIDPGIGLSSLGRCLGEAAPELFIGIPRAVVARRVLGWGKATVRRVILVAPGSRGLGLQTLDEVRRIGKRAVDEGAIRSPVLHAPRPGETAAILFTSGSTGPPKGAVYTHEIFQAQVERFGSLYGIEPGEIDLCTFPLFALFAPALGMTAIVPEMDATRPARVDPDKLFAAIEDFGPTNLFGSPALLRRVGPEGVARGLRIPSLKRVVTAGAPASPRVLETFARLLEPPAEIFTPYGATEALPVASIGSTEILQETRHATDRGAGVCVGRPVEGIDVRIIRITDEPIAEWSDELELSEGTIGEFVVAGPVVTREYFQRPKATALAKIADSAQDRFFHRMGDLGYRDDQGRLWFCGRKSHRVMLADVTLYTICVEGVFNAHPDVARTALVGVNTQRGAIPVLCVETVKRLDRRARIALREQILARGGEFPHTKMITTILFHDSFPVDIRHNSKIFREKLAVWAARSVR